MVPTALASPCPTLPSQRVGHYERLGVASLAEVIPLIRAGGGKVVVCGMRVGTRSLRLQTFARQDAPCCSNPACGLKATHFAVERTWHEDPDQRKRAWHLNLYGLDAHGQEVLFTHDHTLARGLGGADEASNTTTMCAPCNFRKSVHEHRLIKAMRRAQGATPTQCQEVNPDTLAREVEKARGHLMWLAGERGLSLDDYRTLCNEQGKLYAQSKPLRYVNKRHRHTAVSLGLTRNGYRFLRHDHNERQKALRSGPFARSRAMAP